MRVLVTNDDGFDAPGLACLARALCEAGHDVIVVAPQSEASGAGAGIGPVHLRQGGIRSEAVAPIGLEGIEAIAADALPALIVITACLGAFGPIPDLIASGINPGRNVGRAVLHSGTVGAALTSVHFGLKGLATSIQAGIVPSTYESADGSHIYFDSAAALAVEFAAHLETAPPRTVLNLNVPNLPLARIRGVRLARLANTGLNFMARVNEREPDPSHDGSSSRSGDESAPKDSDDALTELGWAVVTPLTTVTEDRRPEIGNFVTAAVASASDFIGSVRATSLEGP
ncbi:MAG: 5'/3'-nucleotidase SurE [Acidimicrobiales bacterium]|jgi:5'-nucleotidase